MITGTCLGIISAPAYVCSVGLLNALQALWECIGGQYIRIPEFNQVHSHRIYLLTVGSLPPFGLLAGRDGLLFGGSLGSPLWGGNLGF